MSRMNSDSIIRYIYGILIIVHIPKTQRIYYN